jgi:hypothetical protein
VERLVALWCPGLSEEGPRGEEVRAFDRLLALVRERCPFVEPVRRGVAIFPARAPSRFFGGEEAVVAMVREDLASLCQAQGTALHVGIADGLFAALCAAKTDIIVPTGTTQAFLRDLPITSLRRSELAVLCQRLGLYRLGQFADLPHDRVLERFGTDGAHCHRVARGEEGDLVGIRDPSIHQRLANLYEAPPAPVQPTFFGGTSANDERALRAALRVQRRLGASYVQVAREAFGHDPNERAVLVPLGSHAIEQATARRTAPWPGRLPSPSPTLVVETPPPAQLFDDGGDVVRVNVRGLLSRSPTRYVVDGSPHEHRVVAWAGPWPVATRWWEARRFRARLQVVNDASEGLLFGFEHGQWWLLGVYD